MTPIVLKPWGSFQVIEEGEKYTLKRLIVKKAGKLSLQSHNYRAEHWIVVQGEAHITLNQDEFKLKENENIFIPKGTKHSIENKNVQDLVIIEVWYGEILKEDDIVRYNDIYGRK